MDSSGGETMAVVRYYLPIYLDLENASYTKKKLLIKRILVFAFYNDFIHESYLLHTNNIVKLPSCSMKYLKYLSRLQNIY
jgi:hypothetical protein